MEILFNNIKPYVRFVRRYLVSTTSNTQPSLAYDARMFYTSAGEGVIKANGVKYQMKTGSVIIINSGVEYHLLVSEEPVNYIAINFDFTFANCNNKIPIVPATSDDYDSTKLLENINFFDADSFNRVTYIEYIPAIEKKLISMEKEFARKLNFYDLILSSAMTDVLVKCFRHTTMCHSFTDGNEVVNKIVTYIVENYNKNLTNKDIAKVFNYHPNYVSCLIKKYTRLSMHQYIKNIRVTKAADMLLIENKSIMQVANECGFFDSSHFIRSFKDVFGLTPQQYREYYL